MSIPKQVRIIIAALGTVSGALQGQSAPTAAHFTAISLVRAAGAGSDAYHVEVSTASKGKCLIGFTFTDDATPTLHAGLATFRIPSLSPQHDAIPAILSVRELPEANRTVSPGMLTLKAENSSDVIAAQIELPPTAKLTIVLNGSQVFAGPGAQSLLLDNGRVRVTAVKNIESVITELLASPLSSSGARIKKWPDGTFRANPEEASANLISYARPVFPSGCCQRGRGTPAFVAMLDVDESGYVQNTRIIKGDAASAAPLVTAAKQWRFTPFLYNGVTVPVQVRFAITIDVDGTARSVLFR